MAQIFERCAPLWRIALPSARLRSMFYHKKVRLVNIILQHRLQFVGVRPILIGHLDSLNQSVKSLQALVIYSLHTEIESRNKWFLFGVLKRGFLRFIGKIMPLKKRRKVDWNY